MTKEEAIPIKWLEKQFGKYCAVMIDGKAYADIMTDVVLKPLIDDWKKEQIDKEIADGIS